MVRPLPLVLALGWALGQGRGLPEQIVVESSPERAVALALAMHGILANPAEIYFVTPSPPLIPLRSPIRRERAVVRAARTGEPHDVYLVEARRSPEGALLSLPGVHNLTQTSAADEQQLVVSEDHAAWLIAQDGAISSLQLVDLGGEPEGTGSDWPELARAQNAVTNLQQTGQIRGIGRRAFKLEPAAFKVVLGLSGEALLVDSDAHKIRIPSRGPPLEGARYVRDLTPQKAHPGNLVTWAVDRVRALSWFGDRRMELVKAVAFEGADQLDQLVNTVTGADGSKAVAEELGELYAAPPAQATDPQTGWPPPPMTPMMDPPLKGEGKWVSLEEDPFILKNPGAPAPFVFSFIRTDKKRIWSQTFVTLWDPRQVELNAMSGTVEPRSATGETGPGIVPRDPAVLSRFVAAFNGGFQAVHGDFGMMSDRVIYLPPKPYAATVAKLADGSTGFGTWPASAKVPAEIVSFRQNMTPLITDEGLNPYKRHWWGGVPPGWTEESRTVRSGVCMTQEGFAGYFYGGNVDPDVLSLAMKRARCRYAVHLDMNAGHTGLEFYRVGPAGTLPTLARKLDGLWEARGPVPDMPGWEFMGRRMIRLMALMNFPRYIDTESRDFFYLTLRQILPGEPIPTPIDPAEPGEGAWRTQGLPQHGWPHAVATSFLRPDPARPHTRVGLIKLDGKYLIVAREGERGKTVIELRSVYAEGNATLWHAPSTGFQVAASPPSSDATRVTTGSLFGSSEGQHALAAIGVDGAGMLLYARITAAPDPSRDAALLASLLKRLGVTAVLVLPGPLGASLGGDDATPESQHQGVRFLRTEGPRARRIFPETPIVPPTVWAPLQQRRGVVEPE